MVAAIDLHAHNQESGEATQARLFCRRGVAMLGL